MSFNLSKTALAPRATVTADDFPPAVARVIVGAILRDRAKARTCQRAAARRAKSARQFLAIAFA